MPRRLPRRLAGLQRPRQSTASALLCSVLTWFAHSITCLRRFQELVPVAVEGTRSVISAAADAGVRRVVFTSSYGAVHMDPNRSPDAVLDETCWSDYDYCKQSGVSSSIPTLS